jgi:hypothetical protein
MTWGENSPAATLSVTNSIRTALGANPGRQDDNPETNCLSLSSDHLQDLRDRNGKNLASLAHPVGRIGELAKAYENFDQKLKSKDQLVNLGTDRRLILK